MILSKREILEEIRGGGIKIEPFEPSFVGACSVDLRLGNYFRKFNKGKKLKVVEKVEEDSFSKLVRVEKGKTIEMKPGEILLGTTLERIKVPNYLCGILEGRSRFARMGLTVHVSSSLIQPGVNNVQVLELVNFSPNTLILTPGTRICQIYFEKTTSPTEFRGKFKFQRRP